MESFRKFGFPAGFLLSINVSHPWKRILLEEPFLSYIKRNQESPGKWKVVKSSEILKFEIS